MIFLIVLLICVYARCTFVCVIYCSALMAMCFLFHSTLRYSYILSVFFDIFTWIRASYINGMLLL